MLDQQIAIQKSQVWAADNKDFLVGSSPDGEDERTEDHDDDEQWYGIYYWDEWYEDYLPNDEYEEWYSEGYYWCESSESWILDPDSAAGEPKQPPQQPETVEGATSPGASEREQQRVANDEERDAAARSTARAAEAAGNVVTGSFAGGFASFSANIPNTVKLGAWEHGDEHLSLSAAMSAHDAEPRVDVELPNDYTVHLSQAARRCDQILYFTSMIGIRPGQRFLTGSPPVIEIIQVERLGSIIIGAPIVPQPTDWFALPSHS